jgi:hypothetical protein
MDNFKFKELFDKLQGKRVESWDYHNSNDFDELLMIQDTWGYNGERHQAQIIGWSTIIHKYEFKYYMGKEGIIIPMGWLPEEEKFAYMLSGDIKSIASEIIKEYFLWKYQVRSDYVSRYL